MLFLAAYVEDPGEKGGGPHYSLDSQEIIENIPWGMRRNLNHHGISLMKHRIYAAIPK